MKIVDGQEVSNWLKEAGLSTNSFGRVAVSKFNPRRGFRIPEDSGKKTGLGMEISYFFEHEIDALLWIDEYGVFPSCQDLNLFKRFRASLGEHASINEKPGHIFSGKDREDIASLITLVLCFIWDCVVMPKTAEFMIKISHDEVLDFYGRDNEVSIAVEKKLEEIFSHWK